MQFHAIQQDAIPNDWKANRIAIEAQLHVVQLNQGDFIVLPEMTDTGWSMDIDAITDIGTTSWASSLSKKLGVWLQVGWADKHGSKAKNCVTICNPDGEEVATYTKVFTCNPFGENEFYDCGNEVVIVDLGNARICPMICYDLRFPELWRPAAVEGVDVFTVSSSWPLARIGHWEGMLVGRAIENQAAVVASNRVGEDSIATWGGTSMIVSEQGVVLEKASTKEDAAISADIDIEQVRKNRLGFPVFDDVNQDLIGNISVRTVPAC